MSVPETSAPSAYTRVVLLGLMGAGKSTVGRTLSKLIHWTYLDNDVLLERQTQRDLTQLASEGASVLHLAERQELEHALAHEPPVIIGAATSTIESALARAHLEPREILTVYLHAAPQMLVQRIGSDNQRPWLKPDPLAALQRMYRARDQLFRHASGLVLEATQPPDQLARTIRGELKSAAHSRGANGGKHPPR